ncbi:hypothetical protein [Clostridium vincentii]|uniref:Uncharacterized protein n=1 Tax=Clostridium vincentii TaxID=52704 RepID=A0A2T0BAE6_9CLOT|nr:hypothetical protein [Clostridium vincentii]PRR80871.1 hypothetical protein CLVI_29290 [Clostridium vincentii]
MEAGKSRYKVTILPMSLDEEKNLNNLIVDEVIKFLLDILSNESIRGLEKEVSKKLLSDRR